MPFAILLASTEEQSSNMKFVLLVLCNLRSTICVFWRRLGTFLKFIFWSFRGYAAALKAVMLV